MAHVLPHRAGGRMKIPKKEKKNPYFKAGLPDIKRKKKLDPNSFN